MSRLTFKSPWICVLFYLATIPATCSNNETDFESLVAFKNAIDADPQGALSSWNETVHFCSWQGVFCGRKHPDRVVAIDLVSRGLVGTISPHLGNMSFLQSITLENNRFYGPIPEEIGSLRRLEEISLYKNCLTGKIPRNMSRCTSVYILKFGRNNLSGVIPLELSSLVKLKTLSFSYNQLSGTIPHFIGNFTSLTGLSLWENRLQGEIPESLIQLQSLKFLNLGFNNLTGRVPHGLFNISTIHTFEISSNQLQGTLPSQMGFSLSSFTWLGLCENQFSGEIPIFLSNFSSLKYICLLANNFSGRVMLDFPRLSALEDFLVSDNNLKDDLSFISSMTNCTRLSTLEIADNQLYGSLPYSIANLSNDNLFLLDLSENQFHGTIPYGIGNLLNLGYLIIYDNDLTGPIPSSIGKLNKLQSLELRQNRLTHNIPLLLENLTLLSELDLSQNNLSGYIPPRLSNLLSLDLSHNNLNGGIPQEIMKMSSTFVYIDLSHNTLTGSIPAEVGLLINLGTLILSHNRLSGLLPDSLGNCVSLEYISMRSNFFSGEIPGVLRNLMSVYYLDLSQNNLSGAIPSFLGELNLLYMNLSFNKLKGEIPNTGVFLNETAVSLEGNTELCGGIQSLRFPPCTFQKSKKKHFPTIFQILIPVISIVSLVSLLYCTFWYKGRKSDHTQSCLVPVLETGHLRLTYGDLLRSTGGFSELNLLGTGRFGSVYKGILENLDTTVAIKVFNINVKGAVKSLMSECSALRGIRHRNLVKIVSVCSSIDFQGNDFKAIVYEYMINGDLDKWLHQNSDDESRTISLRLRVNIAIDIASGLEYLHCSTDSTIVHGDLKPSNILLDENMTAKVADFGLAKVISNRLSTTESNSIGIRGTIGYIPPEYGLSGIVSMEGDVYSFGILLLEMFTGRRPTNDEPNESPSLRDLVRSALPSQVMDIVDPVILQDHNHNVTAKTLNCIVSVLEIGLACSNESLRDRMLMTNVVHELRKTVLVA